MGRKTIDAGIEVEKTDFSPSSLLESFVTLRGRSFKYP